MKKPDNLPILDRIISDFFLLFFVLIVFAVFVISPIIILVDTFRFGIHFETIVIPYILIVIFLYFYYGPESKGRKKNVKKLLDDFVFVEGGTYLMGSPETELGRCDDEVLHKVTVDSFYMQSILVTQELWELVMDSNPSLNTGSISLPVTDISWFDCQNFITKLNKKMKDTYRLPTEAEWEYAARGGDKSKGYIYSGSNNINEVAWYAQNSGIWPHSVKNLEPNEIGVYDMSGNVWEWCEDLYKPYTNENIFINNEKSNENDNRRVLRGGSFGNYSTYCRSAKRNSNTPDSIASSYGFRLVKDI